MKHRLAYRLAIVYGLIFILAVATLDTALILVYRDNQLKKNESFYTGVAGLLSSMAENNIKITDYINSSEGLAGNGNGRVLLLDTAGKVLLDSGGELLGVRLTNPEFRDAVDFSKPATGYYTFEGKGMAMFSHPVSYSGHVNAVVMISVFIQDIYDDVNRFAWQIVAISAFVTLLVVAASIWTGRRLSKPITSLTAAAEQIYNGKIDTMTTVEIKRDDEIGRLAVTFNKMSSELQKVEAGRRRFISDVSHELRTPLASMKVLIEALVADEPVRSDQEDQTDNSLNPSQYTEYREYLQDIDHEIDRLTGLVGSLLTSARLEEVALKPQSMHLCEEVEGILRALLPLAKQKRILLENACSPSVRIDADKDMLREVLINLIDNAIKYGSEGGLVKIACTDDSFSVSDNGCGIPEDELKNIFGSFYRVDRSRTGAHGSGIGLFIVKRIAELHGFTITVSSKMGVGSTFTIFFKRQSI